ncbi:MAG: PAS domain-containing protein [Victivallales bacterium]|jgi:signal transduction histidine kinase|nr:PAS domain-containing protein [Victivallales bacterium]
MAVKKNFLDRFSERLEDIDSGSRQAYILRLMKERGFLETVFNAIEEGIIVIDRHLLIRYHNRAAQELLALPEDLSQVRVSQLLQGVDWQRILSADEKEWVRVARQELEILYPVRRFIQFYLVPYPGDNTFAAVIFRDVTESRARTLNDLEQEKGVAISMLAAGVAHEIGNPLNSLYLNLQMLDRSISGNDDMELSKDEAAQMITACKTEVERLDSIIHSFLSALRPGKPQFAPVEVTDLVEEVLTFMRAEIEARLVTVECKFAKCHRQVAGDSAQLKQVFYNVIRNAVQAMPNGGHLLIRTRCEADYLTLEFADSGTGITPDELGGIFKAFHSNRAGGNGIGMMVIERICREHGAMFGLRSIPGEGTVFEIRFPFPGKRIRMLPAALSD